MLAATVSVVFTDETAVMARSTIDSDRRHRMGRGTLGLCPGVFWAPMRVLLQEPFDVALARSAIEQHHLYRVTVWEVAARMGAIERYRACRGTGAMLRLDFGL